MSERKRDPVEEVEEAWRKWAQAPLRTSPEEAARRVVARISEQGRGLSFSRRSALLATAAALLLALGLRFLWLSTDRIPEAEPAPAEASVTLDENTALIWLDPETPLYLTLAPPAPAGGE